jgi:hypothetical protein
MTMHSLKKEVSDDTFFIILNARKRTISYDLNVDNIPRYLNKNLDYTSYVVFYPHQDPLKTNTQGIMQMDEFIAAPIEENLSRLKEIRGRFRKMLKFNE